MSGNEQVLAFERLVQAANRVQDAMVDNAADVGEMAASAALLEEVAARLEALPRVDPADDPVATASADPRFGIRNRGLVPEFVVEHEDDQVLRARTTFRTFFQGLGSVHGGAIMLLFDDLLGRLANQLTLPMSRTAYLKVDFRAPVPVGAPLQAHLELDRVEGRKRFVRGRICQGDVLLSEAEGLWVELRTPIPEAEGRVSPTASR